MNYPESIRHLPDETRMKLLYLHYVSHNPSLKDYVTTLGFTTHYRSDQELIAFIGRVMGKRSVLAIGFLATSMFFKERVNYN